jgi:hypothetical protein
MYLLIPNYLNSGYGKVYKGKDKDNKVLAVKIQEPNEDQKSNHFAEAIQEEVTGMNNIIQQINRGGTDAFVLPFAVYLITADKEASTGDKLQKSLVPLHLLTHTSSHLLVLIICILVYYETYARNIGRLTNRKDKIMANNTHFIISTTHGTGCFISYERRDRDKSEECIEYHTY